MTEKDLLQGKRVLIVDDEPDVLESLEDLLPMCRVAKASTSDEAKRLLETQPFDIAILDIMGVYGFELLEIANKRRVAAVMLTAHAVSPENIVKSFREGAASYLPKDEMVNIISFLNEILEAKEKGESYWGRWLHRLDSYWERRLGPDWKEKDKEFWSKFPFYE